MTSATAAYRKDLLANGRPFGGHDGDWIAIASLVERASLASAPVDRAAVLDHAAAETERLYGRDELTRLSQQEWGDAWSGTEPLVLLSVAMFEADARHLSTGLLDCFLRAWDGPRDLQFGRALAQRARIAYRAAEVDVAEDLYAQVEGIGVQLGSAELRTRAALGVVALSQTRGNHPTMLAAAERAVMLADETGVAHLRVQARYGFLMSAALFRRFDDALRCGWEMLTLSKGDTIGEALALHSLGQLLVEIGDRDAARSAFSAILGRKLPADTLVAALGSLTLTEDAPHTVDWAISEIGRIQPISSAWAVASALLDCVTSLRDAGRLDEARALRDEVLSIARGRFHELTFRADALHVEETPRAASHSTIAAAARDIVVRVRRLERRLPRHVRAEAVGV